MAHLVARARRIKGRVVRPSPVAYLGSTSAPKAILDVRTHAGHIEVKLLDGDQGNAGWFEMDPGDSLRVPAPVQPPSLSEVLRERHARSNAWRGARPAPALAVPDIETEREEVTEPLLPQSRSSHIGLVWSSPTSTLYTDARTGEAIQIGLRDEIDTQLKRRLAKQRPRPASPVFSSHMTDLRRTVTIGLTLLLPTTFILWCGWIVVHAYRLHTLGPQSF